MKKLSSLFGLLLCVAMPAAAQKINLPTQTRGVLPVANGGTGSSTGCQKSRGTAYQYAACFAGATADVQINAAVAALPATGGTVDGTGLVGVQTLAATLVLGSPTKPVSLKTPVDAFWEATITNGTPVLETFNYGSVFSDGWGVNSTTIALLSSSNVSEILRCNVPGATTICEGVKVQGISFAGNSSATVGHALIDTRGMFDAVFRDVITHACAAGSPALWIHQGDSTVGTHDLYFYNTDFSCSQTGTIPVRITYDNAPASSGVGHFFFSGGDWGAPGPGNYSVVVDGSPGSDVITNLVFDSIYLEPNSGDTTTPSFYLNNVNNTNLDHVTVGCLSSSTASQVIVHESTPTYTQQVHLNNFETRGCDPSGTALDDQIAGSPTFGKHGIYTAGVVALSRFDYLSPSVPDVEIIGPLSISGLSVMSDVPAGTTDGSFGSSQTGGAKACETSFGITTLGTGATTTDSGLNCLPANSVIDAVAYRITTTITTAANFTIGDATIAARFCAAQSTLTAGATGICFAQADATGTSGPKQVAAAKLRITSNVNPGAGAIRLIVYYHIWTPPTN